jgi:thiamine biosynthesis lipoprotein ApbE
MPAERALLAAVVLPSATESDAFSTALLTMGPAGQERMGKLRKEMRTLVAQRSGSELMVQAEGIRPAWGQKPV